MARSTARMADDASHYRRGVELLKAGKLDEAIDELEIAATTGDDLPIEHFALGVAYNKAGDHVAALSEFQRFISMGPRDEKKETYARLQIEKLRRLLSTSPEAVVPTEEIAVAGPPPSLSQGAETTPSEVHSGEAALTVGSLDEAMQLFEAAVTKRPLNAAAWNGLGKATFRRGLSAALAAFEKAARLDAASSAASYNAGRTALLLGDVARARSYLEIAARLAPEDPEIAELLKGLG